MATLLEVVQDLCGRQNITVPNTVFGSTDPQVVQIMKLLEEEGNDLAARASWERLIRECAWTTINSEDQGAIDDIAPGFRAIKNNTIWDRTDRLPVLGPVDGQDWQALKAVFANGPRYQHRIRTGRLLVNPVIAAGHSWYFEYLSKYWIADSGGTVFKRRFTADTDAILLPDDLCLQGLRWRWKKEKGLDYAEDFRTYELQAKDQMGRDGGKRILSMDGDPRRGPVPGVWVSPGNWPL